MNIKTLLCCLTVIACCLGSGCGPEEDDAPDDAWMPDVVDAPQVADEEPGSEDCD